MEGKRKRKRKRKRKGDRMKCVCVRFVVSLHTYNQFNVIYIQWKMRDHCNGCCCGYSLYYTFVLQARGRRGRKRGGYLYRIKPKAMIADGESLEPPV